MQRVRRVLVILSVVLAVGAVQMPASAAPADDAKDVVCWATTEVHKYGWHVQPVCL